MPQTHADPDELDGFASTLTQFLNNLENEVGSLNHSFEVLGDTWQDAKRQKFEEEFKMLQQQLLRFHEVASEQMIPYLRGQAQTLREYLGR